MNTRFYSEIENSFTSSRLSVYKQDGADNLTCLARYLYNIEVCKSLYSSLNIFEVTFRNAIDKVLCTVAGADNWYDILTLDSTSMKNINDAKHKIQKKGKPVTHDRIVSELTFGFWTSLLTPRYSQASFQSKIIKTVSKVFLQLKEISRVYKRDLIKSVFLEIVYLTIKESFIGKI